MADREDFLSFENALRELQLNEEQLKVMLQKLGPTVCYLAHGRKFTLNDGELMDEDDPSAAPVSWPLP